MAIILILLAGFAWLLRYRCRDRFLRSYILFFLILLIYASNKLVYGIPAELHESTFSPLSLVRWSLLGLFLLCALRMPKPGQFSVDVPLAALIALFLGDALLSSLYANDLGYSLMRAGSFALLAAAMTTGTAFYLFWNTNCLLFFRFHYYVAWLVLPLLLLLHLVGVGQSFVTVLMGQYAGFFGNQNMYGTFSALLLPYVLFHWHAAARTQRAKWLDLSLLGLMLTGVWLSGSRNGMSSCVIAGAAYFFVVNLQSRLKIAAAAVCFIIALAVFPTLKSNLMSFIRKGTDKAAQVTDVSSQIIEERRYEMWTGVWPLFWKQPLTGYGFASSHLLVFEFTQDEEAGRTLHNSYLETFGDLGLPGLTLLLLILYRVSMRAVGLMQQRGELLERQINAVFIAVFAAGSANACFESWMFSVGNLTSLLYWGPAAGIVARWAWRPAEARESLPAQAQSRLRYLNS